VISFSLETDRWFSPGTRVSSTTKTDLHDVIVESGIEHHNTNNLDQQKVYFTRKWSEKMHREIGNQKNLKEQNILRAHANEISSRIEEIDKGVHYT